MTGITWLPHCSGTTLQNRTCCGFSPVFVVPRGQHIASTQPHAHRQGRPPIRNTFGFPKKPRALFKNMKYAAGIAQIQRQSSVLISGPAQNGVLKVSLDDKI